MIARPGILQLVTAIAVLFAISPAIGAGQAAVVDATSVGVVGDGATLNTASIQKAIDDCAGRGGGTIRFPAGRYRTGTIQIKSNVMLRLDAEATLLGSNDVADYRNVDPFIDGSGHPMGHALIVAVDADHVGIEGPGTIDGHGRELKARQDPFTVRPFLLRWIRCTNVTVRDVHLTNPGSWTLNFFQTRGALIEGITIRTRERKLLNNDGINIDSCQDVRIRNCDVNSGDDALVIKSTSATQPSRDIAATDCKLSTRTNAIKLGTESIGGFENISVSNCQITNTQMSGIALYTVDGGDLRNVTISEVTMDGVMVPISIRLGARLKTFREGDRPRPAAGHLRDVTIRNVSAKNVGMIGMLINGVPGHPIEALNLENIQIELPGGGTAEDAKVQLPEKETAYPEFNTFGKTMPAYGIYARHVRGMKLQDVRLRTLQPDARPERVFIDAEQATTGQSQSSQPAAAQVVNVWPAGKMPGAPATQPEAPRPPRGDNVTRITNVSTPTLTLFPAPASSSKPAPAMIVCPGGGYSYVVVDKEGSEIAAWLNSLGISAMVLKYRVPQNREGALQDLERALSLARAHAGEWNIEPRRLGVIGFSAGGNLAAKAGTPFANRAYAPVDAVDQQSCRPDFAVLVYPAYLEKDGKLAPDLKITPGIPPTLIVHTEDDRTFISGSKLYHAALDEATVPNQFQLYATGGHGYALHCTGDAKAWPDAAARWFGKIGVR